MTAAPTRTPLLRKLLDGERTWGSLEISDGRYGTARYRLVVYPPGLHRDERIPLRLWRAFPIWGLAVWLVMQVFLMVAVSTGTALALSTGTVLAAGAVVLAMAGPARGAVRTLTVLRMVGIHDPEILARHLEFRVLAERLVRADALRAAGEMSTVEHEAEVWHVYEAISPRV